MAGTRTEVNDDTLLVTDDHVMRTPLNTRCGTRQDRSAPPPALPNLHTTMKDTPTDIWGQSNLVHEQLKCARFLKTAVFAKSRK
jgi:hypothetical protein